MSVEEIASGSPTGDRDAPEVASGPNPTAETVPYEGTANPLATTDDDTFDSLPLPAELWPAINLRDFDWDRTATWHLRRIGTLSDRQHQTRQAFDKEIQRLEEKRDMACAMLQKRIDWHRTPLLQLHRALLTEDPSRKTIELPYGKLKSSTPQKPTVRIMDREAFTEWARMNAPDLVEAKWSPNRKAVIAALGDTLQPVGAPKVGWSVDIVGGSGEIVPGLTLGLDDTTFSIHMDDEL